MLTPFARPVLMVGLAQTNNLVDTVTLILDCGANLHLHLDHTCSRLIPFA